MQLQSVRDLKLSILETLPSMISARSMPETVGLGVGKNNQKENVLAVRFYGKDNSWRNHVANFLRNVSRGELDIQTTDRPVAFGNDDEITWHRSRTRPLKIGCSISHGNVTAGTLGCFVQDKHGNVCILSNNHVIANQNDANKGDKICQPGTYDKGTIASDSVATLSNFVKIAGAHNLVDAAIAKLNKGEAYNASDIYGLGKLEGIFTGEVEPGDMVAKFGRTTGTTLGRVTAIEMDNVAVGYSGGTMVFDQQIEIEGAESGSFSAGGDSGSMVVSAPKGRKGGGFRALGLLFAGGSYGGRNGQGLTYVNYMSNVVKALEIKVAY